MLSTLLLLSAAVASIFLALRTAGVYRGARRTRQGLLVACVVGTLVGATAAVFLARDAVMCPIGTGDPTAEKTRTATGKGGMKIVCTSPDGIPHDGSLFAAVFAWVGAAALIFAGSMQALRAAGVRPLAPPPPKPPAHFATPTDKKDRRRARKARKRNRKHD